MKKKAYILVISAAILWGIIGLFVRTLSAYGFSPMQLISFRAYISAAVLVLFLLIYRRPALKIRIKDIWYFIGTGIISFVFFNYCYFIAIGEVSLSVAAILLYTAPIFVMLLSLLFFKEKLTKKKSIALILAFCGCLLTTGIGTSSVILSKIGIIAGALSGFLYALYSIFAQQALKRYSPITVTAYTFVFASIGVTPFADLPSVAAIIDGNIQIILLILLFGFVTGVLPYYLYTKGLYYLNSSRAAIISCVEPVVATVIGLLVFGETLTFFGGLGIFLVIFALIVLKSNIFNKKQAIFNSIQK